MTQMDSVALTRREREILKLMANDLSNREIAEQLVVSNDTVKWYVKQIYEKLDVHSRDEAIQVYSSRADLPLREPPAATLVGTPTNLPARMTPLVGRRREIEAISQRILQQDVRLITLIGTGGIGKTRLSIEVGEALLSTFPDGVFLIELAPLVEPALVPDTVLQVLGLQGSGDPPVVALKSNLRIRRILLIFDNFEHLLPAATFVGELLASASQVKVLATSREPLRLYGEIEYPVPLLPLTNSDPLQPSDAVSLFLQRARAVKPDFSLTADNAGVIAQICARLDGLPLAIELAAARGRLYSPEVLLRRLDSRLNMLSSGARDLPERHQTLRGAIAWSYDLLDESEKDLFAQLSVFHGGWTLEAFERVCMVEGDADLFDIFESLLGKSLVQQRTGSDGEPRFHLLETIREFALELLGASGEIESTRLRHAAYVLRLADEADRLLLRPESYALYARLDDDIDNLRTALDFLSQREDRVDDYFRAVIGLGRYWGLRCYLREGLAYAQTAYQRQTPDTPLDLQTGLTFTLARAYEFLQYYDRAGKLFAEMLPLARAAGNIRWTVFALRGLAAYGTGFSDPRRIEYIEEAMALVDTLDHPQLKLNLRVNYAAFIEDDGSEAFGKMLEENLRLARQVNDTINSCMTLQHLSAHWLGVRRYDDALKAAVEGINLARQQDLRNQSFMLLTNRFDAELALGLVDAAAKTAGDMQKLARTSEIEAFSWGANLSGARVAAARSDRPSAVRMARAALVKASSSQPDETASVFILEGIALLSTALEWHDVAARLFAAEEAIGLQVGLRPSDFHFPLRLDAVQTTRNALGEETWQQSVSEGRSLTLGEAWEIAVSAFATDTT